MFAYPDQSDAFTAAKSLYAAWQAGTLDDNLDVTAFDFYCAQGFAQKLAFGEPGVTKAAPVDVPKGMTDEEVFEAAFNSESTDDSLKTGVNPLVLWAIQLLVSRLLDKFIHNLRVD